jgi:nitrogen fixation protein FixH
MMEEYNIAGVCIALSFIFTLAIVAAWYGQVHSPEYLARKSKNKKKKEDERAYTSRTKEWNVKEYNRELVRARLNYLEHHPDEIDSVELVTILDLIHRHDSELLMQWLLLFSCIPEEASKNTRQL